MSVTFSADYVSTGRFFVVAGGELADERFGPYDTATEAREARQALPESLYPYGVFIQAESLTASLPSVNMANSNAADVLLALDLDTDDLAGSEDAATFRARVLVALATERIDAAEPAYSERMAGGAMLHSGGRAEGYVGERLAALLEVAEAAEGYGVRVVWG